MNAKFLAAIPKMATHRAVAHANGEEAVIDLVFTHLDH